MTSTTGGSLGQTAQRLNSLDGNLVYHSQE